MKKVAMDAIKPWITETITKLLNFEDDVLINYIFSLLEEQVNYLDFITLYYFFSDINFPVLYDICLLFFSSFRRLQYPDPKSLQVNIAGFLEKETPKFMSELWNLLLEYVCKRSLVQQMLIRIFTMQRPEEYRRRTD